MDTVAAPLQPLSLGLPGPVVNWPLSEAGVFFPMRSGASQSALTTGASTVGCAERAAKEIGDCMTEMIITTRRGVYGRVNVTLPLTMKLSMLAWAKRSGMKKAEFLRMALTTGFLALSNGIPAGDGEGAQGRATGREEDARSASSPHRGLS